jgi:rhodanese-related sulfurtransferase
MSINTIQPKELAELLKNGTKIELIDVRTPAEFQELHLEAARNVPLDRLDPEALLRSRDCPATEAVYVICRSGGRGKQACEKFVKYGFLNVVNVDGGTLACVAVDIPTIKGKKTISLERQVRIAAGTLVVLGTLLAIFCHPSFVLLSGFVGAGLIFAGITDTCGMAMILARMPWNQCSSTTSCSLQNKNAQ